MKTYDDKIESITSTLVSSWDDVKNDTGLDVNEGSVRHFENTIQELQQIVRQPATA